MSNLLDFLTQAQQSVVISFYIDNLISIFNGEELAESPIARPMGVCRITGGLAIATKVGVAYFKKLYLEKDDIFIYRQNFTKHNGMIDCHEIVSLNDRLIFANTLFSCLSSPSFEKDFEIVYQPGFIESVVPEDHAHLNGIAKDEKSIRFISCFSPTDSPGRKNWRHKPNNGCVWDVQADEPVITNLSIPHSPRFADNKLYVCESGKGRVIERHQDQLRAVGLGSFTRGLIVTSDFLIVGTSKIRDKAKNKSLHRDCLTTNKCGLHLIDRLTLKLIDSHYFEDKQEIFDLQFCDRNTYIFTANSKPFEHLHLL